MYIELAALLFIFTFIFLPNFAKLLNSNNNDNDEYSSYDEFIATHTNNLPNIAIGANLLSGIDANPCDRGIGLWVGTKLDANTNCKIMCNSSSAEYSFYNSSIYVDNALVKPGGYCGIPLHGQCNLTTTTPIYSNNKWKCLSKYPELGGALGTKIQICDGHLYDRKTKTNYLKYIPVTLNVENLYEQYKGDYRFVCADKNKIRVGNQPFATVDNYCMKYMPHALQKAYPDFKSGVCECEKYGYENIFNDRSLPCTNIQSGVNATLDTKTFKSKAFRISRPCLKAYDTMYEGNNYPCGIDNFVNSNDAIVGGYILPSNGASPYVEAELK